MADDRQPVVVAQGRSAASASDPTRDLDDGRYHIYEANPVPWWVVAIWVVFISFAITYLISNLIE
jgi:hypothetical protein